MRPETVLVAFVVAMLGSLAAIMLVAFGVWLML
jgi:hypothetical protein